MSIVLDKQKEILNKLKEIKNLDGELFREKIIQITKDSTSLTFQDVLIKNVPLTEYPPFICKKELSIKFWNEISIKTHGKLNLTINDSILVPSKLFLSSESITSCNKENLSENEIENLVNTYRRLFESVRQFLLPAFEIIINKNGFIYWFDILKKIKEFENNYDELFKSMDNNSRRFIAHESYYLNENFIMFIDKNGNETKTTSGELCDKLLDITALIFALYWGLSEVFIPIIIKGYQTAPIDKLKKAFVDLPFLNESI